jgi:hypothetical protein
MPNYATILTKEQIEAIRDFVHSEYGRKSGLVKEDYTFHFDTELENEIEIIGGNILKIAIRATPFGKEWHTMAKRIFTTFELKQLLRTSFNNNQPHISEMKAGSEVNNEVINKKHKEQEFSKKYKVTSYSVVRVFDRTTKHYVEIKYTGSSFDAIEKALEQLRK